MVQRDIETDYYLSKDRKLNTRNLLDAAYENAETEEAKRILLHAILHINGSSWLRDQDAFFE